MKYRTFCWLGGLLLAVASPPFLAATGAQDKVAWWPAAVEQALGKAGNNRPELEKALHDTPSDQRPGMSFLIANTPDRDLLALKADFLLRNVELAYKARWGSNSSRPGNGNSRLACVHRGAHDNTSWIIAGKLEKYYRAPQKIQE